MISLDPQSLRPFYGRFLDADRILLTGHSHQAWPDVAREGVLQAFDDAAAHVDDKWSYAMAAADAVRSYIAAEIGGPANAIALAPNTHELVVRFLSALDPLRRHLVTTDGEFHSISRQLRRLEEAGVEITRVPAAPHETLAERLAEALRPNTAALLASTVLFETSTVVPHLERAAARAHELGAEVLFDSYHHFGVRRWKALDARAFVVGGGYKYCQWGEGVCFMRVPEGTTLRPVYTGWFSDFANLEGESTGRVGYGNTPADRFAGSTYDPVSHYRARAVIEFFQAQSMSIEALEHAYARQTNRIIDLLGGYEVLTPADAKERGGFVAVRVANAAKVARAMRDEGVFVDARRDRLRFGPAPYVTDDEVERAVAAFRGLAEPST
ncbi:MAG: aminotransferase class V-fold PLP-dependent enzyme [Myxococcota bacterium]